MGSNPVTGVAFKIEKMKRVSLLIVFLLSFSFLFAQYPQKQTIGSDSSVVQPKGALQGRLINWGYSDTAHANLEPIHKYPGAQIRVGDNTWHRSADTTRWILDGSTGSAISNGLDSTGGITLVDSTVTIKANIQWTYNGVVYRRLTDTSFIIHSADSGYYRRDLIYADTSGKLYKLVGVEDTAYAIPKALPPYSVTVTIVDVYGSQIGVPTATIIGTIPNLQQVTDQGNSTTNPIFINSNSTQTAVRLTASANRNNYIYEKNSNNGHWASTGFVFKNDVTDNPANEWTGHWFKLSIGSTNNDLKKDGSLFSTNDTGGMEFSSDSGRVIFSKGSVAYSAGNKYRLHPYSEMGAFETNGKLTLKKVDSSNANISNIAYFDGDTLKRGHIVPTLISIDSSFATPTNDSVPSTKAVKLALAGVSDSLLKKMDTAYFSSSPTTDTIIGVKGGTRFVIGLVDTKQGVIYGCNVYYISGLTYGVTAGAYKIGSKRYTTAGGQITLPAADSTYDTKDIIALDSTGPIVVAGTPSANPASPQLTSDQLYLTDVTVKSRATTPSGVSNTIPYDENTEWTFASTGFTADPNNIVAPFHLTKDIYVSAGTSGNYFSLTSPTLQSSTDYTNITLHVRINSILNSKSNLSVQFFNGTANVSNSITLDATNGFSKSITGTYQTITIPFSNVNFNTSSFDRLRFTYTGTSFVTFYVDYVTLQTGVPSGGSFTQVQSNWNQADSSQPDYIKNKPNFAKQIGDSITANRDTIYWKFPLQKTGPKGDTIVLRTDTLPKLTYNAGVDTSAFSGRDLPTADWVKARIPARFNPIAGTNITLSGSYPNITFNSSGGGGTIDTTSLSNRINKKQQNLGWVNVMDYGADSTGTYGNYAAFTSAENALGSHGTLFIPKGSYRFDTTFIVSSNIIVRGEGMGKNFGNYSVTKIFANTNIDLWKITAAGVQITDVGFEYTNATAATSARGLYVYNTDTDTALHQPDKSEKLILRNVSVRAFYKNIYIEKCANWLFDNVENINAVSVGLHVENTTNQDAGDWSISNGLFFQPMSTPGGIALEQTGSGGGKIVNVKFNGAWNYCIWDSLNNSVLLLVSNCSFENFFKEAIHATSGQMFKITGCEFAPYRTISGTSLVYFNNMLNSIIANNLFIGASGTSNLAVELNNCTGVTVSNNNYSGFTSTAPYTISGGAKNAIIEFNGTHFNSNIQGVNSQLDPNPASQAIAYGSPIIFDASLGASGYVTLTGNTSLSFANFAEGMYLTLVVIQDATGGRTLTLPAGTKVINYGGGSVTLTADVNAQDILCFVKINSIIYCTIGKAYN